MTDRELLELAAKAAGIGALVWGDVWNVGGDLIDCTDMPYIRSGQPDEGDVYWNPLTDDGDALRLAVDLELDIYNSCISVRAIHRDRDTGASVRRRGNNPQIDAYAATRRAIVSAAAEIGKAMP